MKHVQLKLPDDHHSALKVAAFQKGVTLQAFCVERLGPVGTIVPAQPDETPAGKIRRQNHNYKQINEAWGKGAGSAGD